MKENRCKTRLKRIYKNAIVQTIESWTGTGIFDSNWLFPPTEYRFFAIEAWIEFKQITELPKKETTLLTIPWRKSQIPWAMGRILAGAKNLYLCILIEKTMFLIHLNKNNLIKLSNKISLADIEKIAFSPDYIKEHFA